MISIGLDLSLTATGVYVLNGTTYSTEINTKPDKFPSSIARCDHIASEIIKILNKYKPDSICIESYFVGRQPKTVIQLAELGSIVRIRMLESGYSYIQVAPTALKKYVTGLGNCGKDVMIKEMFKKYGVDTNSNNIADAAGLAYFGRAVYNMHHEIDQTLHKYQEESVRFHNNADCVVHPYSKVKV